MQSAIIVAGGRDSENKELASCEQFNVQLNQWSSIASLNKPRRDAAAAAHSHSVFVFGGYNPDVGLLDEIEEYNTAADKWTVLQARLTVARYQLAAAYLDDSIYMFGGYNDNKLVEASSATECFNVQTKQIKTSSSLLTQSYLSVATSVTLTAEQVCFTV